MIRKVADFERSCDDNLDEKLQLNDSPSSIDQPSGRKRRCNNITEDMR